MPYVAPWLKPTDILAAIEAGGHLGLASRSEANANSARAAERSQQASEAAAKLRLETNSLAQQAEIAHRRIDAQHAQANAALQLRGQQANSLQQYRQDREKDAAKKIADAEAKQTAAQALKAASDEHTAKFMEQFSKTGDASDALAKFPMADPKVSIPILSQQGQDKRLSQRQDAVDARAEARRNEQEHLKQMGIDAAKEAAAKAEAARLARAHPTGEDAPLTPAQRLSNFQAGANMFKPLSGEDQNSPAFNTRTNAGRILMEKSGLIPPPAVAPQVLPQAQNIDAQGPAFSLLTPTGRGFSLPASIPAPTGESSGFSLQRRSDTAMPLPDSKKADDLIHGQVYDTKLGALTWDGNLGKFVAPATPTAPPVDAGAHPDDDYPEQ